MIQNPDVNSSINIQEVHLELGDALARVLGDKTVALLRGHGNVVVGSTIPLSVYRAMYTETNARLQMQALSLGGPITYLDPEEGRRFDSIVPSQVRRAWELWKKRVMGK